MIRVSLAHCSDCEVRVIAKAWGAPTPRYLTRRKIEREIAKAYREAAREDRIRLAGQERRA